MTKALVTFDGDEPAVELVRRGLSPAITGLTEAISPLRFLWNSSKALFEDSSGRFEIPAAVDPAVVPPAAPFAERIAFQPGPGPRGSRMTGRVLEELRRRGSSRPTVAYGATVGEVPASAVDEWFPVLGADDLLRLASASVWLDTGAEEEGTALFPAIVAVAGFPLVVPKWSKVARRPNVTFVEEWSADAFCDALTSPKPALPPDPAPLEIAAVLLTRATRG
jgi:hypothetical protein